MFNFSKKSKYPLGIDISDLSLKLIQLDKIRGKIKIQAINNISLKPGIIENGEIVNSTEFNKELKVLLSKPLFGTLSSNKVVASLPDSKTYIKLIKVEKGANALKDIIANEIQKNIPLSENDIYYDWQIISSSKNHLNVLIGAAQKTIVESYIQHLEQAGLDVIALEPEPAAVIRALIKEEKENTKNEIKNTIKNCGIIDIGAKRTNIIFYAKGSIISSLSLPISGEEITKKISKTLDINIEQAEKAKIICGLDKEKAKGIVSDILKNMVKDLIKKIKDALDFYETNYEELGPLENIILCGGGANIKNLDEEIEKNTGINTKKGSIKDRIDESDEKILKYFTEKVKKDKIKEEEIKKDLSLSYVSAIGLALRNICLEED